MEDYFFTELKDLNLDLDDLKKAQLVAQEDINNDEDKTDFSRIRQIIPNPNSHRKNSKEVGK
jgi:hypothetical protein